MATAPIGSTTTVSAQPRAGANDDQLLTGALIGGTALGIFGAAFSYRLDRLPRLAAASAATGVLGGGVGGALLASGSPIGDPDSRLPAAAGGAIVGGSAGALLLGALAGIILPPMSSVTRFAAAREFALYGLLAGGVAGAGTGMVAHDADRVG